MISPKMAQISPSPTTKPYASLAFREILGRQENPVCGYISANQSRPLSCRMPEVCASSGSFQGCCAATTSCFVTSSCIESTTPFSGCDGACSANTAILKCGFSPYQSYPYCATRYWNEATLLTQFVCDDTSSITDEIYTTYINEQVGQYTISEIGGVGVVTATTTSSTTQTSIAPPSTSMILSALSSTSETLSSLAAIASPPNTTRVLSAPSSTSKTLPSLPATASPTNQSTARISSGALAGIGVGVVASLLIGMAIILFYHYHTRHHRSLQLSSSQTPLSAQIQALSALRSDTQVPRTVSNFGRMPRGLQISGSVDAQQGLLAGGTVE